MFYRLCLNLCERSLYRASSGIRFQFNRSNHTAHKNEEQQKVEPLISTKYPDYKVIYIFPYIKYASNINVTKQRFTIFIGATIPVSICLYLTNIVSLDAGVGFITNGLVFTVWLHSLSILCNNLVGYIYLKSDNSRIILSYINYWGKRIDLESPVNDVIHMSDNPRKITDRLFKRITFASRKETLKLNMKFGQITHDNFKYILGMH